MSFDLDHYNRRLSNTVSTRDKEYQFNKDCLLENYPQ